jgi:hypothetical protein
VSLETLTLALIVLNAVALGTGFGIYLGRRKIFVDISDKLKKFDEIAEAASNSSQSIARKVAELQDKIVALNIKMGK